MPVMIQIRSVPEDIHRTLKARAATEGRSLSDLLLDELRRVAGRPSVAELKRRLATREPVRIGGGSAAAVRREREGR